ncbi:MAG: DUF2726 domain-containing protein, partial [Opitutae bacterium]|nr:DUF2726 domain-containing protein [Opitutae bacterium]
MPQSPPCPQCGATMLLRTAKTGANAGNQFWGCPHWHDTCKGVIIDYDPQAKPVPEDKTKIGKTVKPKEVYPKKSRSLPVLLSARARRPNYQVRFFDSSAFPKNILDGIARGKLKRSSFDGFSQWRLDSPISHGAPPVENLRNASLGLHKLLIRGSVIFNSRYLEEGLSRLFRATENVADSISIDPSLSFVGSSSSGHFPELDESEGERIFYDQVLPKVLGPSCYRLVLPQVDFASLLHQEAKQQGHDQRVDFLLTGPKGKLNVEIDGEQHNEATSIIADNARDDILKGAGILVMRITSEEIRDKGGQPLELQCKNSGRSLSDYLSKIGLVHQPQRSKFNPEELFFIASRLSHQIQVAALEAILSGIDFSARKFLWDYHSTIFDEQQSLEIINLIQRDLDELFSRIFMLHGVGEPDWEFQLGLFERDAPDFEAAAVLTHDTHLITEFPTLIIEDIWFPQAIQHHERSFGIKESSQPDKETINYFLDLVFRYQSLREGQYEGIARTLKGQDSIILLPTGAGKSVIYQLSALLSPGVAIIIS